MNKSITKIRYDARNRQAGMTAVGIMIILIMVAFFAFFALKLFPIYMESFKVNSALDSIQSETGLGKKPSGEIVTSLMKKLEVDDVESVTRKEVSLERTASGVTVYVDYEVVTALFGNISLLVIFEKQAELDR